VYGSPVTAWIWRASYAARVCFFGIVVSDSGGPCPRRARPGCSMHLMIYGERGPVRPSPGIAYYVGADGGGLYALGSVSLVSVGSR
jgi:hypothetical protein